MKNLQNLLKTMIMAAILCCFNLSSFGQIPCPIPVDIAIGTPTVISSTPDECIYEFGLTSISDPNAYCVEWTWAGNGYSGNGIHQISIPCDGEVVIVCALIHCCEFPGTEPVEVCYELIGDCCETDCVLPQPGELQIGYTVDPVNCDIVFDTHLPSNSDYCYRWTDIDGSPLQVSQSGSLVWDGDCPYTGEVTVNVDVYCCEDESQLISASVTAFIDCTCCEPLEPQAINWIFQTLVFIRIVLMLILIFTV